MAFLLKMFKCFKPATSFNLKVESSRKTELNFSKGCNFKTLYHVDNIGQKYLPSDLQRTRCVHWVPCKVKILKIQLLAYKNANYLAWKLFIENCSLKSLFLKAPVLFIKKFLSWLSNLIRRVDLICLFSIFKITIL